MARLRGHVPRQHRQTTVGTRPRFRRPRLDHVNHVGNTVAWAGVRECPRGKRRRPHFDAPETRRHRSRLDGAAIEGVATAFTFARSAAGRLESRAQVFNREPRRSDQRALRCTKRHASYLRVQVPSQIARRLPQGSFAAVSSRLSPSTDQVYEPKGPPEVQSLPPRPVWPNRLIPCGAIQIGA